MDIEISSSSHRSFFSTSLFDSPDRLVMTAAFSPVIFDKQHALARLGGLEDVLRDVMHLMTTESPRVYAEIGASFQRGDIVALKRSAHTLKGAVGMVGAIDLVRRLRHVEDSATSGELANAATEFDEIDRQFAELQRILALELMRN
jgi:two-component system sensor histidine kinase/response regulator